MPRKHKTSDQEDDQPSQVSRKVARKTVVIDAPTSGRPKRSTRGQGGVVAQLAAVGAKITENSKRSRPAVIIPDTTTANNMAPAAKGRRGQTKEKLAPRSQDKSTLGSGVPKPVRQAVQSNNSVYGFRPATNPQTGVHQRITQAGGRSRLSPNSPLPSSKARISDRFSSRPSKGAIPLKDADEVIPDSAEENDSADGNNDHKNNSGSDSQDGASNDEQDEQDDANHDEDSNNPVLDKESEEEEDDPVTLSQALGMPLDLDVDDGMIDEMDLDPQANDDAEEDIDNDDFIDEMSPDEEDRQIMKALGARDAPSGGNDNVSNAESGRESQSPVPFSVLNAHHQTNRTIRAPNPTTLLKHTGRHRSGDKPRHHTNRKKKSQERSKVNTVNGGDDEEADDEESGDEEVKKERAPRNSKSDPRVSKPTQLKHYSANRIWKNLLQDAKYEYRRHIHTVHAFPERNTKTLTTAGDFLMDIITKYEDNTRNAPLDAEYFDKESMSILVFEDGSSYRGQLKTLTRELVYEYYSHLIQPDMEGGYNQMHLSETIKRNIDDEIHEGYFLRGGVDENNKTRNFGNPLIKKVASRFYYSGKANCLAVLFPDDFAREFPRPCLAMVCVCILNCLREYSTGSRRNLLFSGKVYAAGFNAIMALIAKVDDHKYHGERLTEMLEDIALIGMRNCGPQKHAANTFNLKVVLD